MSDVQAPEVSSSTPSLADTVVTQVEFYLSDSNLPFDKFLFGLWSESFHNPASVIVNTPVPTETSSKLVKHAESKHDRFHQGWIPLSKLTSFKRMSPYLEAPPSGLGGIDEVAKVLEASTEVEARKFGEEGQEGAGWYVRKTHELERPADVMDRSIYAKGFPVEEPKDDSEDAKKLIREKELDLQKRMESWARSLNVGKVLSLRMRREDKVSTGGDRKFTTKGGGKFKGSIFLEFADASSVAKFLALDPKPTFEGAELEIKSKSDYVEEKRQIYAPGTSKPAPGVPRPSQPGQKGAKAYNAWGLHLIGDKGFPAVVSPEAPRGARDDKKRKAEDGTDEREILFDGVRFTARRTGGEKGSIEIVDEDKVGTGEGQWTAGKLLKFTVAKKDGSTSGPKEQGDSFNVMELKSKLTPLIKTGFIDLNRPIAGLPGSSMAVDAPAKSEFPTKLTAPPTVGSASAAPAATESTDAPKGNGLEFPAQGQASFREQVTDEIFEKIKSEHNEHEGRTIVWTRASPEDERAHILSRARWHAKEAFGGGRGGHGGRGGARGGRGGQRGGGRGGNRGRGGRGGDAKRQRRD